MCVILSRPRVRVCDDGLQVDTPAGMGGGRTEGGATCEEVRGSPERRREDEEESGEPASAWPGVTESNALLVIPSFQDPRDATERRGAYFRRKETSR